MHNYTKLQRPVFTHDCGECVYLGTTMDELGMPHDWYTHDVGPHHSIVARYADSDSKYWSLDTRIVLDDQYLMVTGANAPQPCLNEKVIIARYMLSLKEKS